jgi:hypothetical protein
MILLLGCNNHSDIQSLYKAELVFSVNNAAEPSLYVNQDDKVIFSYINHGRQDSSVLNMVYVDSDSIYQAQEIAKGKNWFVNWADFPSLVSYKNNPKHLASFYLEKSAQGTYDYDIKVVQSKDGGTSWQAPFTLHSDNVAAEHGFVSFVPVDSNRIFACWLDGRNTKMEDYTETVDKDHHAHGGAMTLRAAEFDIDGKLYHEVELDSKVCDCCNTDVVNTSAGPVLVYRDRSDREVRDISIVRKFKNKWTDPRTIHDDLWTIAGCPVNGPAMDSYDHSLVVGWFTLLDTIPVSQLIFSSDDGAHFSSPVSIDIGNTLGRMDLVLTSGTNVWVSWVKDLDKGEAMIMLSQVDRDKGILSHYEIQQVQSSRCTGFPKILMNNNILYLAWTECLEDQSNANLSRIVIRN